MSRPIWPGWLPFVGRGRPRKSPPPEPRERRQQLSVEELEGRVVPAVFNPANGPALAAAIVTANGTAGGNTINLQPGVIYQLSVAADAVSGGNGLKTIAAAGGPMVINGNGATITRGTGAPNFRIINIAAGANLTLNNVSITNGASNSAQGAGVMVNGTLTANGCTFSGNQPVGGSNVARGGAIWVSTAGTATINSSTLSGNTSAWGGAILTYGKLYINDSTLTANKTTTYSGGAITGHSTNAKIVINRSTISYNQAASYGGGIIIRTPAKGATNSLTITNSTITGNSTPGVGGGIRVGINNAVSYGSSTLTLTNCTISGNASTGAGGGLYIAQAANATATINNSIIAGNAGPVAAPDVGTSAGANPITITGSLVGNNNGSNIAPGPNNLIGTPGSPINAMLDPQLRNNGGITQTLALLPGSPAIDPSFGATSSPLATDQRGAGFNRIINGVLDIGAFEFQPPMTTTTLTSSINPVPFGQSVTFTATVAPTATGSNAIQGTVSFVSNGTVLATVNLVNGVATFTTSSLPPGSNAITAQYNGFTLGSYTFSASTATLTQTVNPPPPPPTPPPPPSASVQIFVTGTDAGPIAQVNVYNALTQQLKYVLYPFGIFTGGVRVAVGDFNGDGVPDIICGAGPGALPQVNIYDGRDGNLISTFIAFSPATASGIPINGSGTASIGAFAGSLFRGGVFVAAGDVNSDGIADIVIGAGAGTSPQIQVFDGQTGGVLANFFAFGTPFFTGGVHVAVGDVTGAGHGDIIVSAAQGGGPQVQVYDGSTFAVISNFYAFNAPGFTGGVWVAAGNVFGGKVADIICGAGSGGGPQVTVYDSSGQHILSSFFAYAPGFAGGVRVGTQDLTGSGRAAVLTAPGHGAPAEIIGFDVPTLTMLTNFFAYNPVAVGGAFVT
jgi:hypothetical protein